VARRRDLRLIPLSDEPFVGDGEATIYACGPSLAGHDFEKDPPPWFFINETILLSDFVGACVLWDLPPARRIGLYCQEKGIATPETIAEADLWFNRRQPGSEWIAQGWGNRYYSRRDVQKANARFGTGAVCLCLAKDAGARRVRLVGFDTFWEGEGGHGICEPLRAILERLEGSEGLARGSVPTYRRHAEGIRRLAADLEIELTRGS